MDKPVKPMIQHVKNIAKLFVAGILGLSLATCGGGGSGGGNPPATDSGGGTAATAPQITTQPVSQTVTITSTATFSVVATGTAPFTYQWSKNGTAISGATAANYTTPALSTADSGAVFTVTVTNSAGNVTSSAATLSVTAAPIAPQITSQPASQTVTAGSTATFTVTATGTAPFTYQWSKNGTAISGATAASYTTPALSTADSGASFTVTVTNSAGNVTSSNAGLRVFMPVVPHSGIKATQCYGADRNILISCLDSEATSLNKQQDGMRTTVNPMSYSLVATAGGGTYDKTDCVKDNITGLIWEGKPASGTRGNPALNPNGTYTNYDSNSGSTAAAIAATTNAQGYANAVNATGLCGYTDWRLPTAKELQSIVDYGVAGPGPTIDSTWFPNTQGSWYWTSSPYVGNSGYTWYVYFGYGNVGTDYRDVHYVRLVRGSTAPAVSYSYSEDGSEVTDNITGLIWRRCSEGQEWSGSNCKDTAVVYTHQQALARASNLTNATSKSWRVPNVKELASIIKRGVGTNPSIDTAAFPDTPNNWFWSSSPFVGDSSNAWIVDFNDGYVDYGNRYRDNSLRVRLVRAS